jgi:hypothetical protein
MCAPDDRCPVNPLSPVELPIPVQKRHARFGLLSALLEAVVATKDGTVRKTEGRGAKEEGVSGAPDAGAVAVAESMSPSGYETRVSAASGKKYVSHGRNPPRQ